MGERQTKPLRDRCVIITRTRAQSMNLCAEIARLGGEARVYPTIRIADPASYTPLDEGIAQLQAFDWVIFTSPNAVHAFFGRMRLRADTNPDQWADTRIAAVGPKTAEPLQEQGLTVEILPGEYRAEALLSALADYVVAGDRILLPRVNIARKVLPDGLREMGCSVTEVEAYRNEIETKHANDIYRTLQQEYAPIILFTSSSTVRNFVTVLDCLDVKWRGELARAQIACIGPLTAQTACEHDLYPDAVATTYTAKGLLAAVLELPSVKEDD